MGYNVPVKEMRTNNAENSSHGKCVGCSSKDISGQASFSLVPTNREKKKKHTWGLDCIHMVWQCDSCKVQNYSTGTLKFLASNKMSIVVILPSRHNYRYTQNFHYNFLL